ncbi:uncharacterized protein LOC114444768 [Parambassis ranga]|uniref:Uncharacterized protein LOC114444768 n=1 Tax=Parambassis ranga TaxID=210632 RepID=A0A6P7JEV2_9TELE|nr:uncharacterized protein LOC114444768 [Parambassis ranga]
MASSYNLLDFQSSTCSKHSKRSLQLLALGLIMFCKVTDIAATDQVTGELKGNVTFDCHVSETKKPKSVYVQRGSIFLNGFYGSRPMPNKWPNTIMYRETSTMVMFNLKLSHIGTYCCHIWYTDGSEEKHEIQLSVTAKFSKPSVTTHCTADNWSCLVTCQSHGGYPSDTMMWEVNQTRNTSSQMWKVVNSSEVQSTDTMVFNISSTASFNCSEGALLFTCSIGDLTSDMQTVCAPAAPHEVAEVPLTGIAICVVAVFIVVVVAIAAAHLYKKCRKRRAERPELAKRDEGGQKKDEELQELAQLAKGNSEMEAP